MKKTLLLLSTIFFLKGQAHAWNGEEINFLQNCQISKNCHKNDNYSFNMNGAYAPNYKRLFLDFYDRKISLTDFSNNFYLLKNKENMSFKDTDLIENIILINQK